MVSWGEGNNLHQYFITNCVLDTVHPQLHTQCVCAAKKPKVLFIERALCYRRHGNSYSSQKSFSVSVLRIFRNFNQGEDKLPSVQKSLDTTA